MKRISILFSLVATLTFLNSCVEEDKFNNPSHFEMTDGVYVKFVDENPPSELGVAAISDINYSFAVEDISDLVASYDLKMYADLSGVRTDTVDVRTVTSFPESIDLTASDLATLLEVTVEDISFGDSFFLQQQPRQKKAK